MTGVFGKMSTLADFETEESGLFSRIQDYVVGTYMVYQRYVDKSMPHTSPRWISTAVLALLLTLRILTVQGFYVVAYAWAIYMLNIFLLFLSPKFMPGHDGDVIDGDGDEGLPVLPNTISGAEEEFRPFIRRLPEFKFWYNATWSTVLALCCTLFDGLDIPVFWPILLMYFIFLFALTMRRQIHHMIRYKYIPFDIGKKSYSGIGRK